MAEWNTTHIEACLARIRAGDVSAREELFAACRRRLELLVHSALHTKYPNVRRLADTQDVLQDVCIRLDAALKTVPVTTAKHFLCLASNHIRFALLGFAREVRRRERENGRPAADDPPDPPNPPTAFSTDEMVAFHEEVDRLPADEREVFWLTYYFGLSRDDTARVLGVSLGTVKLRWARAKVRLSERLRDRPADGFGGKI